MKYCYFKTRNRRGFTLVELMVVLAVTAILAALAGGGLLAYIRLARFQKNESNARAMFQTAQLATAQLELAGEKDDFTAQVATNGHGGHITQPLTDAMKPEECEALNARVYALYFDKGVEPTPDTPEGKLYAYIKQYVYDSSFLDAAFCIEIDASTGQVFSVFYDSGVQALRFANNKGQTDAALLDDRSYQNRRDRTLVGYYCADDAVNVVNLQQSKLRVRNQRLINGETLDLTWGGTSKSNETDTQYTVDICSKTTKKKLFSVLVTLPTVTQTQKELPVTLYNEDGSEKSADNYFFPLRYANGSFVLTLDAMNDAAILQAHSEDASIDKTEFFSITRFVKDATDIYATITAAPRAESVTSYTVSEGADTNTENSLYANASADLQCFRHLYNLRWYAENNDLTAKLTKDIDWLSGAPVVYCAEGKSAAAKTPAADAPVAWPSLLELKKNVTLNGNNKTITGLQLRGNSVAENGCRYIGLVAENSGTIQDLTLADPDVLVNLTAAENGTGATATYTVGGEALALMATDAEGYRENVRAVGALCGVSTGTVENCTVKRSKNRTATARVAASLTFNDQTTTYTRQKSADGKTIENEPLGIGGLVGSAVPGNGKTLKDLTVDKNVTVAGIWQDGGTNKATAAAANETTERTRITATDIDRAIGVGGVFGVLSLQESCTVDTLNNSAEVCGNAYTGGVAGNLCGKSAGETIATNLNNTGSVQALAGYQGYTAGESRVLGQFFGGVAGRMKNAKLTKSYSSTRSSLSENDIKTLIVNGYNPNGTLSAASPLQGDFVGGLVGFGEGVKISHCQTGSGYVLGNTFVGGVVGGLSSGTVLSDGTANSSHVFGHRYVGGVVSFNGSGSTITGMSNTGMTAAFGTNAAYAGGIVGYNEGTLENCTAAASTNTATNASRVQLLQAMAKGYYADFVGGVAGCNAGTITWTHDAAVSTLLHGGSFVGGVVGFNDAGAAITVADSAALTVSGRIAGVQDAVGGLAGLNCGTALPAVTVKAELVSGRYCVGGVLGANVVTTNMTATGLCTDGSGNSLQAQALAGGIVGYNQVIAAMPAPAENNTITRAKLLLPVVSNTSGILTVTGQNTEGTATVTLNNCTNALNLTADAYVGGVVGWGEHLALNDAQNGALHSVSKGVLHSSGSLQAQPAPSADAVTGNAAGGIIGYAGGSATLQNCQNFAGVFHKQAAGGIAGYNAGTIQNCTQSANLGTRQTGYTYIGGIAGVNAGTIQTSAPDRVTISGEQAVGGVAGLNTHTIQDINNCTVTVQGSQAVGGLAGKNNGTVQGSNLQNVNVAASGINAGGAVGQNSGTVQSVTVTGGSVQGSDAVGGLAGENLGRVESCKTEAALTVRANQNAGAAVGSNAQNAVVSAGNYAGTVYAASSNAGGIAGQNAGSIADNATVSATVTCENGDAGGVAALNSESGTISAVQVKDCTVNSGSAYMAAVAAVNNGTIQGVTVQSAALQGDATVIGGIAGVNNATIGTETCTVQQTALDLDGLTAADITLGGAAGQNDATINNVQVALNVTQNLAKYRTLGGVAGVNNGTLQNCAFTAGQLGEDVKADAPAATGAAKVGDAIGGVAGVNNRDAKVENCTVRNIRINVLGITNVESSQDVETKLNNASHVGGIVGRNSGTIQNSIIGTDESSAVIAKYGFVGGVAGSNAGEISGCGGKDTAAAVSQIQTWLGTDGDVNTMIAQLKYSQGDDNASETASADETFTDLRGVDAVRDVGYTTVYTNGLTKNQLTVALRGSATNSKEEAAGYLGGVTGYNTDTGVLHDTATGKWFVYCDNGNVDNAVIGGMIGQNESDKDMTNLLNCAAVRRFNRTMNNATGNDDTQNSRNQHVANANVGGVIGVQQNRSSDRWSLTNVVNYGTVHNSRSNNLAGIICLWVDNGGTLEHCFNFGTMRANSNGGGGSGTMGGIVALFDKPVAGGTTNLVSCQNHGDMLWENESTKKTANDVGGILGKIQMKNASDYLVVNITDCVNGSIKMQSNSLCVGIMAWLGPEGAIPNAEVNIDRCRNYCMDTTSEGGAWAAVGIYGNRGNGGSYRAATTITNCFVLNASNNSDNAIMRPYGGSREENIHLDPEQPNLYMDKSSFDVSTASDTKATPYALETLKRGEVYKNGESYNEPKSGRDRSNKTYFDSIIPGYRLYAGKNTTDNTYFAALITGMGAGGGRTLEKIDGGNSYIQDNTIVSSAAPDTKLADILFPFGESGKADDTQKYSSSRPDMSDITDTAVQAYYKDVLDKQYDMENAEVTNIIAVLSDATGDGAPIYGRYRVTWKAVTGASHYKVTVKVQGENGEYKEMPEILPTATVYTNQYTFEAPKEWAGKKYIVEVTPCNSQEGAATSSSTETPFIFAKTLPTPQMEVRVFETGITLYMKNIDDYDNAQIDEDWAVTPSMIGGGWNWSVSYDKNHFETQANRGKGYIGDFSIKNTERTFSLRASAKTKQPSNQWMQSDQYNVQTYMPKDNFVGLGKLTMTDPVLTGTTADALTIATDLSISGQTYNPKYRIMLQGRCQKDITVDGENLNGQYVTLQAVETVLSGSPTRVTFTDLPAYALTDYSAWRILAAPVNTGMGDTTCRWQYQQENNPYPCGREYVREADGNYTEYSMSTLYNISGYACTVAKDITLTVLPAPALNEDATWEWDDQNNLLYTFTWNNAENAADYTYKLYGVTDANNEVEINLPAGAATLKTDSTQTTLTVAVDKLANGAADWHFAKVRLAVTSVPQTGSANTVGATASKKYEGIRTRLTQPGAPNSILLTNNADAETLPYKITWTGIADDALDHYELLAEYKDSSDSWQTAETWQGTNDASLTVNLEKYQGKTLRLRVVAVPAAGNSAVLRSPYSATSIEFTVVTREAAPTVNKVEFTNPTPTQDEFLNRLQVQFTVNDSNSHYVTGYLFKDKTDYDAVVNLVNAWKDAEPDTKADKLKALQDKLAALLADETETKAVCLIPQDSRTTGVQAETTGNTVRYTLTPDKFAMQPQYGDWYLLPAVRTMTTAEDKACSVWTYYTTTALQVPCIRLDTPLAVRNTSAYTGTAIISDTPSAESGAEATLTVQRIAVQWSADNLYTADGGETMLADTYEVTVTPTENNGNPHTLRITVQPKDEYEQDESGNDVLDENGNPIVKTARGTVTKVEKTVDNGATYFTLDADNDGSWYLDTTQATDANGNTVPQPNPTKLTGTILQEGNLLRYYTMKVRPMLQYDAAAKTYSLILPDLAQAVYADPSDPTSSQLTPYTAEVKITAKGANVQPSQTAEINPQQTN